MEVTRKCTAIRRIHWSTAVLVITLSASLALESLLGTAEARALDVQQRQLTCGNSDLETQNIQFDCAMLGGDWKFNPESADVPLEEGNVGANLLNCCLHPVDSSDPPDLYVELGSDTKSTIAATVGDVVEVKVIVDVHGLRNEHIIVQDVELIGNLRGFELVSIIAEPDAGVCTHQTRCPIHTTVRCKWASIVPRAMDPDSPKTLILRMRATDAGMTNRLSDFNVTTPGGDGNPDNNIAEFVSQIQGACCSRIAAIDAIDCRNSLRADCPASSAFSPWSSCGGAPCKAVASTFRTKSTAGTGVCMLGTKCLERVRESACGRAPQGKWHKARMCRKVVQKEQVSVQDAACWE